MNMSNFLNDMKGKKLIIDVNSSSIVDLKAELFRKQEQVRQKKANIEDEKKKNHQPETSDNVLYSETITKNKLLPKRLLETVQQLNAESRNKKPKPLNCVRSSSDNKNDKDEPDQTEEHALKLSRINLERKAQLYEQMVNGSVPIDHDDENILVNFQQKHSMSNYESNDDDQEKDLIEYVDQFGRTKMVTPEEFEQLERERKMQEKEYQSNNNQSEPDDDNDDGYGPLPSIIEDQPRIASTIHYQHVREGEVRDHGVGFYSFSADEQTRGKQMEMLDELRKQTEASKNEKQRIKEKRKQMLRSRLEKIASRKGINLPEEDKKDDDDDDNFNDKKDIKMERATLNPNIYRPKSDGPREWDLGKEGVPEDDHFHGRRPKPSPFYSHDRYQEKLRQERNPDFAPPSSYSSDTKNKTFRSRHHESNHRDNDDFDFIYQNLSEIRKKS